MLRPAALHSALEALLDDGAGASEIARCETALLALPDSGLLYASAHRRNVAPPSPRSTFAASAPANTASAAPTASALMGNTASASFRYAQSNDDERARALAAVATQAWREEVQGAFATGSRSINSPASNTDRGRGRSTTLQGVALGDVAADAALDEESTKAAPAVLFHSELGASLVMPLRAASRSARSESDPNHSANPSRRAQQESQPVMLLVLNSASYNWIAAPPDHTASTLETGTAALLGNDETHNTTPTNGAVSLMQEQRDHEQGDIWTTMLELAHSFEAHVSPALTQAFAPPHQHAASAKLA